MKANNCRCRFRGPWAIGQKMPALEEAGLCGRWDNYRTIFEDFRVVYLFGLQMPLIIHLFVQNAVYPD